MTEPIQNGDTVIIAARSRHWRVVSLWHDLEDLAIARIEAADPESIEYAIIRVADLRRVEPPPEPTG